MVLVFIDIETTSTKWWEGGILQVGISYRDPNGKEKSMTWNSNPSDKAWEKADPDSMEIHGITRQKASEFDRDWMVAKEVRRQLNFIHLNDPEGKLVLMAFNRNFDAQFLARAPWRFEFYDWGPCVMYAAENHWDLYDHASLQKAAEMVADENPDIARGIEWLTDRHHDAQWDAVLARLVFEHIRTTDQQAYPTMYETWGDFQVASEL